MSTMSPVPFNPVTQTVTVINSTGGVVDFTFADLDLFVSYNARVSINYGAQLGACIVMLLVTAILTNPSKRLTAIFVLNILALVVGSVRALLLSLYAVSPWSELYAVATNDYTALTSSAYAFSVASTLMPLLMTTVVDASLVLQAHSLAKTLRKQLYYTIAALSVLIYLLAVGFRLAEVITNSEAIVGNTTYFNEAWIQTATLVTETLAIWFFSIIFTGKLIWTIRTRQRMGFEQWSYMQILAAGGGCTMVIPSIFASLEYANLANFPESGGLAMTIVALLLPLSSLWAAMSNTTERATKFNLSSLSARKRLGSSTFNSNTQASGPSVTNSSLGGRNGSTASIYPSTNRCTAVRAARARDSTELDFEMMGIRVNQGYSVHSDMV